MKMKNLCVPVVELSVCVLFLLSPIFMVNAKNKGIYHKGWIDFNKNGKKDIYEDPTAALEKRVQDLLSRMTLEEKTCQTATLYGSGWVLKDSVPTAEWKKEIWSEGIANIDEQANGQTSLGGRLSYPYAKSILNRQSIQRWFVEQTRLGIPVDFTNEGIFGLCHDRATMFPAQCGLGATWDRSLIRKIGETVGSEASALGYTNVYSPIMDVTRDQRWGRSIESYGEDPYLVGELGKEMVVGMQSQGIASTVKHFAVYSVPIGGRDGDTRTDPQIAPREMKTLLLEPFRKAFEEGGAMGTMSSYNDYDGVPITGSYDFLTNILRKQWGFKGYVVSDSEAVEFLYNKHHVAADEEEAAAMALRAGLNVRTHFTFPDKFILPLRKALKDGKISQETLDERVAEVLRVKFRLGLFDHPYKGDSQEAERIVHDAAHQQLSLQAALESIVLLKNENNVLPLSKNIKKIAVIGPNADEVKELLSRYGPANAPLISVYKGIREELPASSVRYAKGCEIIDKYFPESELYEVPLDSTEKAEMNGAVELAKQSDLAILVLGGNNRTVGESRSRSDLNLFSRQEKLLEAVYHTGTPLVLVLIDGRAASVNWAAKYVPAIVEAWFPGEFTGKAIAKVLFGDYNPGGKLAVTFPKSVGEIPYAFPFKPGANAEGERHVSGALFPFGYGRSYTNFEYGNLHIDREKIKPDESLHLSCEIKNTGKYAGDEIVQLYIHQNLSSVVTFVRELRGFERIHLLPGETKTLNFTLKPEDLSIWDIHDRFTVEPGTFSLMVGASSEDIRLKGSFEVEGK